MSLAKSTRLGHYEDLELIGKGGMGEVYRGCDTQFKSDVALKVPPNGHTSHEVHATRLPQDLCGG